MAPTRVLRITALAVCAAWLAVILVWGPAPFTITFDDAFYYFQIGKKLAQGHGSTFNGIDQTNGYHPLWQLLCAVPYLIGLTGLAAVRAVLVFQLVLYAATLWVVAGIVGARVTRASLRIVVPLFVLVAANPYVIKTFVNGLESGITALAYVLLIAAVTAKGDRWIPLLLVFAFVGRTDALFVVGCLFLVTRAWKRFVPVAAIVVAYLAFNQIVFGNPLQVSGVVKRQPLTAGRALAVVAVALFALGIGTATRRVSSERFTRTTSFLNGTSWFAAACVLLVGYYRVLSVETYLWYYAPLALYLFLVLLHLGADFGEEAVAEGESVLALQAILVVPMLVAFGFGVRQIADPQLRSLQEGDRAAALWVRENTSPDTVIASWDAGIIGYFSGRPVVNLDGVVNSFEWEDATHHAPDATRSFLNARRVSLVVNHGELTDGEDADIGDDVAGLWGPGTRATQLHREEYVYSGSAGGVSGTRRMATFVYEITR